MLCYHAYLTDRQIYIINLLRLIMYIMCTFTYTFVGNVLKRCAVD